MGNARKGFTLVELLIVIAIISVLAGMLLPALSRAKHKGAQTVCIGNVRQLLIATTSYALDNNGLYPTRDTQTQWPTKFQKYYVQSTGVLRCPSDRLLTNQTALRLSTWFDAAPRSYLMNAFDDYIIEMVSPSQWTYFKEVPMPVPLPTDFARKPSETIIFGEKATGNFDYYVHILLGEFGAYVNAMNERRHGPKGSRDAQSNYGYMDGSVKALHFSKSTCPVNQWAVRDSWRTNAALCRPR